MITIFEVSWRERRLTKSGRPTKSCSRAYWSKRKCFDALEEAEKFAKQYSADPMSWVKIEPIQIDNKLLIDIFHL